MSHSLPPVPVVCAIIERAGEVLVAQRPPHKLLPLKWEFPGGKVEPGEHAADALVREIREELGCDLVDLEPLPTFVHDYGAVVIEMIPFVAQLSPGAAPLQALEHVSIRWIRPELLGTIDLAAADRPILVPYLARVARRDGTSAA
ncbi:MAG TPA: (deoxy)nucleoside triphosphate pyrophosphohydrolase [Candidatus Synoicihabitans sp.]|nr:(deoxy)nucleoside triphosphate pyrophosphohydrolase [Candidatus Synoicihabitans sp.]